MGGRGELKDKWKKVIDTILKKVTENNKRRYMVIIGLVGILIILFSNMFTVNKNNASQPPIETHYPKDAEEIEEVSLITTVTDIESSYEKDLQAMLNQVLQLSEVEVMINIDSTNVNVYEKDLIVGMQTTEETDQSGGQRHVEDETRESKLVYLRQGDQEVPLLVQTKKPQVRGVLIVAKGAENATTKKSIIDAVSKVLDVPTYRISVMSK